MATTSAQDQAEAAKVRCHDTAAKGSPGDLAGVIEKIGGPAIVPRDVGKYVLIEIKDSLGNVAHLVRMDPRASYHMDAASPTLETLRDLGIRYKVLGGGRIDFSQGAAMKIYGHSYGFPWDGPFRHDISAAVVKGVFPGITISTSDEGY